MSLGIIGGGIGCLALERLSLAPEPSAGEGSDMAEWLNIPTAGRAHGRVASAATIC